MRKITGTVADIQRASRDDGPGIRTTVFFKGCPLHCKWCHNPECISFEQEIMFYPENCIHCGMCDKGCFCGARVTCGKVMTFDEIMTQILLDKDYYGDNGGVTFSGGEPMAQSDILGLLLDECRRQNINTAIETSMIIYDKEIFKKVSLIMADLKIWDCKKHIEYTGVSNEKIIQNFTLLDKLNTPFIVRTPVIPGINDDLECIKNIKKFLKSLKNVIGYELLPYHPLGVSKQVALGHKAIKFEIPSEKQMKELQMYADL